MTDAIHTLDSYLSTVRPGFYAVLKQPLTDSEINQLEERYKIKIPADLRILYKWKNGQDSNCAEAFVNNSMFVSLEEALETAAEFTSMIGLDFEIVNWWNENWIPIFHNGGGDFICYDLGGLFTGNQGQLIKFMHADNRRNVITPGLETLISKINQYYDSKQENDFDGYFEIENPEGYPQKFLV